MGVKLADKKTVRCDGGRNSQEGGRGKAKRSDKQRAASFALTNLTLSGCTPVSVIRVGRD